MRRIREILRLKWERGLAHREIARACSVGVGTVSEYVRRARAVGLSWPLSEDLDDAVLEARLFSAPSPSSGKAPPDVAWIHQELKRKGVTLQLLWEEYAAAHPEGYRYSQFCELYRRWAARLTPTMRQRHRAGEKVFVDYSGLRPRLTDRRTGQTREVELFVGVLGASSLVYAEASESQDLGSWIGAHVRMVEFWGGSVEIFVPDNLRSGVTTPCRYEAEANRTYEDFATHYGAVVIPARVRKPRDKAKAESGVQVVQRWVLARLRNRTFFDLAELNEAIAELLDDLNDRPMRDFGASRRELFERLDRPALLPLPGSRYELARWKTCRVNIDYHVRVEGNFYSVPYQLCHEKVETRRTQLVIEIYFKSRRVSSHTRLFGKGKAATKPEHMPSSHRAHAEWTPSRIVRWAEQTGPAAGELAERILADRPHPEQGFRACLGVIRLGRKYGSERLEAACARALRLNSCSYKTVSNILSSGSDRLPLPGEEDSRPALPLHENVRGGSYYHERNSDAQSSDDGQDARDEDVRDGRSTRAPGRVE